MKKILLLVGLVLLSPDLLSTDVAHAAPVPVWRIRIDNHGHPDKPAYWGTDEDIIVGLCYIRSGFPYCRIVHTIQGPTGVHGDYDIYLSSSDTPLSGLSYIFLTTTGADMFVVDQIEVYDADNVKFRSFGVDNNVGYCLSSDPNKGSDPACNLGGAHCQWKFSMTADSSATTPNNGCY